MTGNQYILGWYILVFNKILVFDCVNNGDSIYKEKRVWLFRCVSCVDMLAAVIAKRWP